MKKKILIAEDDPIAGMMLSDSLTSLGYSVTLVENGRQALQCFLKTPFQVVLTDLDMPEMGGKELISHLKNFDLEPLIFVITSHTESALIIEIMKEGIHDFIIKPADMVDLTLKLKNAFNFAQMRKLKYITDREKQLRLENHLNWANWQARFGENCDKKKIKNTLFESLHTSFNQGAGFGGLVSLLKIVSSSAEKQDDFYKIDSELMELIKINASIAEKALSTFSDIGLLISNEFIMEDVSCINIYKILIQTINEMNCFSSLKDHRIIISDIKKAFSNYYIKLHRDHFKAAFFEVLINALKFSKPGSDIYIIVGIEFNQFNISVINIPLVNSDGTYGIPMLYENIVFEPFFRLTKFVSDEYSTLDFGLGLTKVDTIISKHGGKVEIRNIIDHSNFTSAPLQKVLLVLSFPVKN